MNITKKLSNMKAFKLLLAFMVSIITFSNSFVYADDNKLESGIYEIKNEIYHDSELGKSMARGYTSETMRIEARDSRTFYTVKFSGTEYMENFRIVVEGKEAKLEVLDKNDEEHTITLKFEVGSITDSVEAKIYVGPMERDVEFDIIAKEDTLTLIEKIEEPKEEVKAQENKSDKKDSKESTNQESKGKNGALIGGVALVVGVAVIFVMAKRKK